MGYMYLMGISMGYMYAMEISMGYMYPIEISMGYMYPVEIAPSADFASGVQHGRSACQQCLLVCGQWASVRQVASPSVLMGII